MEEMYHYMCSGLCSSGVDCLIDSFVTIKPNIEEDKLHSPQTCEPKTLQKFSLKYCKVRSRVKSEVMVSIGLG